jgi:thymidine kinase
VESEELVVVGAAGMYEARCRRCFEPNPALAKEKNVPLLMRKGAAGNS